MNRFRGFLPAMLTGFVVTVFAMAPDTAHAADAPVKLVGAGTSGVTGQVAPFRGQC